MFVDIIYPLKCLLFNCAYAMEGAPQDAEGGGIGYLLSSFLPLILIFLIFYFLLIRPQSKRAKEHRAMLENLKKGDKIITSGGIYGVIEGIETNTVTIKIAENVKIKVSRNSIASLRTSE